MKKILIGLSLCLILALSCVTAAYAEEQLGEEASAETITEDGIIYSVGENAAVIGFEGEITEAVIMPEIGGKIVTSIADDAFYECESLEYVTIPDTVTYIGENAFAYCIGLKELYIPPSVKEISHCACDGCSSLSTLTLSEGLETIGMAAFGLCTSLTEVKIPSSVETIYPAAFNICTSLSSVTLSEGLKSMGYYAFAGCSSLTSVTVPSTVETLYEGVFTECTALSKVTLCNGVRVIKSKAFSLCPNLKEIIIPASVETVGDNAFKSCKSLSAALFKGDAPSTFGKNVFLGCSSDFKIYYSCVKSGWTTPEWKGYTAYPMDAPPSFDVKVAKGGRTVTFNCLNPEAVIYYSTKTGSLTTSDKCIKPGETVLFTNFYGTLYARAYCNGRWSNVARNILRIPAVNTPTITKLSDGRYKISTTTPVSIVYFTIDGSDPSETNYFGKFWTSHDYRLPEGAIIKAIAVRFGFSDSEIGVLTT